MDSLHSNLARGPVAVLRPALVGVRRWKFERSTHLVFRHDIIGDENESWQQKYLNRESAK